MNSFTNEPKKVRQLMEKISCGKLFEEVTIVFNDGIKILVRNDASIMDLKVDMEGEGIVPINPEKIKDQINKRFNYSKNVSITDENGKLTIKDTDDLRTFRNFESFSGNDYKKLEEGREKLYKLFEEPMATIKINSKELNKIIINPEDIKTNWVSLTFNKKEAYSFSGGVGEDKDSGGTSLKAESFEGEEVEFHIGVDYLPILSGLNGEVTLSVAKIEEDYYTKFENKDGIFDLVIFYICVTPTKEDIKKRSC